ncbi:hypothetical protein FACUT_10051 [Fusarium acutatum]|uniref:Uncharacterized protein n=1 Tax=Fusarium acutatum TaxID=78861 RepID=A0A8H4JIX3_9HYPO|nr:hypothetical protein FACUT_10051 [Fusarium acutatum]
MKRGYDPFRCPIEHLTGFVCHRNTPEILDPFAALNHLVINAVNGHNSANASGNVKILQFGASTGTTTHQAWNAYETMAILILDSRTVARGHSLASERRKASLREIRKAASNVTRPKSYTSSSASGVGVEYEERSVISDQGVFILLIQTGGDRAMDSEGTMRRFSITKSGDPEEILIVADKGNSVGAGAQAMPCSDQCRFVLALQQRRGAAAIKIATVGQRRSEEQAADRLVDGTLGVELGTAVSLTKRNRDRVAGRRVAADMRNAR